MELAEIKIRHFKELITGILLGNGTHWSLMRVNVVDYVLDGFQFTNKKYIVDNSKLKEDTLLYKILTIKNSPNDSLAWIDLNVLDEDKLLSSFLKKNNILVAICLHREDVLYVGKIKKVNSKSLILDSYDTELNSSGLMKIEFNRVRYVQMHTDYLDSLSLLLDKRN